MIAEPDVAMTDFALAVEGGWLGGLLYRRGMAGPARRWWAAFFAALALLYRAARWLSTTGLRC